MDTLLTSNYVSFIILFSIILGVIFIFLQFNKFRKIDMEIFSLRDRCIEFDNKLYYDINLLNNARIIINKINYKSLVINIFLLIILFILYIILGLSNNCGYTEIKGKLNYNNSCWEKSMYISISYIIGVISLVLKRYFITNILFYINYRVIYQLRINSENIINTILNGSVLLTTVIPTGILTIMYTIIALFYKKWGGYNLGDSENLFECIYGYTLGTSCSSLINQLYIYIYINLNNKYINKNYLDGDKNNMSYIANENKKYIDRDVNILYDSRETSENDLNINLEIDYDVNLEINITHNTDVNINKNITICTDIHMMSTTAAEYIFLISENYINIFIEVICCGLFILSFNPSLNVNWSSLVLPLLYVSLSLITYIISYIIYVKTYITEIFVKKLFMISLFLTMIYPILINYISMPDKICIKLYGNTNISNYNITNNITNNTENKILNIINCDEYSNNYNISLSIIINLISYTIIQNIPNIFEIYTCNIIKNKNFKLFSIYIYKFLSFTIISFNIYIVNYLLDIYGFYILSLSIILLFPLYVTFNNFKYIGMMLKIGFYNSNSDIADNFSIIYTKIELILSPYLRLTNIFIIISSLTLFSIKKNYYIFNLLNPMILSGIFLSFGIINLLNCIIFYLSDYDIYNKNLNLLEEYIIINDTILINEDIINNKDIIDENIINYIIKIIDFSMCNSIKIFLLFFVFILGIGIINKDILLGILIGNLLYITSKSIYNKKKSDKLINIMYSFVKLNGIILILCCNFFDKYSLKIK